MSAYTEQELQLQENIKARRAKDAENADPKKRAADALERIANALERLVTGMLNDGVGS